MLNENFQSGFYTGTSGMCLRMDNVSINSISLNTIMSTNYNVHYGGSGTPGFHVMIGGGDTAPTRSEYDMADASIMASNKMKSLTTSTSWTKGSGGVITTQWQNASSEAITVKEVALGYKMNSPAYAKSSNAMVARKVLTTPITIQPSEIYAFSYSISI